MSDRVPDLDLGDRFALRPWRVRRAGYGAMQLASDGGFGAAPGIAKRGDPAGLRRLRGRGANHQDPVRPLTCLAACS